MFALRRFLSALAAAGILSVVVMAVAAAHDDHASGQWPTSCVELNDIVEAHLGRTGNVGIYQSTFGDQAEEACRNDHRQDVQNTFPWSLPTSSLIPMEDVRPGDTWPTTCVELNDIVEAHLGNTGNVGIYQSTFGDQAEQACRNDHRDDVRLTFAWALENIDTSSLRHYKGHGDLAFLVTLPAYPTLVLDGGGRNVFISIRLYFFFQGEDEATEVAYFNEGDRLRILSPDITEAGTYIVILLGGDEREWQIKFGGPTDNLAWPTNPVYVPADQLFSGEIWSSSTSRYGAGTTHYTQTYENGILTDTFSCYFSNITSYYSCS